MADFGHPRLHMIEDMSCVKTKENNTPHFSQRCTMCCSVLQCAVMCCSVLERLGVSKHKKSIPSTSAWVVVFCSVFEDNLL